MEAPKSHMVKMINLKEANFFAFFSCFVLTLCQKSDINTIKLTECQKYLEEVADKL